MAVGLQMLAVSIIIVAHVAGGFVLLRIALGGQPIDWRSLFPGNGEGPGDGGTGVDPAAPDRGGGGPQPQPLPLPDARRSPRRLRDGHGRPPQPLHGPRREPEHGDRPSVPARPR